ncbi:response regulator [Pseudotabrizicola alkalilacus]|uniref:Response regulator n=1 Tax=Pseudotabrizicola alkalilacus TaxID=2305252 RepID=A0A411Z831_9RHOB|nr:response regulator [Pseudotabrizicola alkalilacus]RGP39310.1 response regulator [Pseudotabrizicola alkalilacus]
MPVPVSPDAAVMPTFLPRGVVAPEGGALPLSGVTILLVEDSRFASDALRLMCQRSGARLRRAHSMANAQAHLRTYCPDVAIVDLGLPDGRGDRLIRDLTISRRVAVVLGLSGDPDGRGLALAAGAKGFLEKPLQGLGTFQRAILRHMPGRFALTARDDEGPADAAVDPLALRDDLAHAAALMALAPDAAGRGYLARFVAGVARSAGDADLAEAAAAAALRAEALPQLHRLVHLRLGQGARF